jgi:16S rRNA (guanine966-N2)-methyltransferase
MRIVSGEFRGRTINPPAGLTLRPTTDMAKESLFNILENRYDLDELTVLDLFAGTGSISYEFLSRGVQDIVCVDINVKHTSFIEKTCKELQCNQAKVVRADVFSFLKACTKTFDIIFADPPYDLKGIEQVPQLVFEKQLLNVDGVLIVEHAIETDLSKLPFFVEKRKWGKVNMSFFERD